MECLDSNHDDALVVFVRMVTAIRKYQGASHGQRKLKQKPFPKQKRIGLSGDDQEFKTQNDKNLIE